MSRKRLLFVAYGGGHINMLLPVIKFFRAEEGYDVSVLGLTTASRVLSQCDIPHMGFKDFLAPDEQDIISVGEKLSTELGSSRLVSREETVAYLGLSYKDLVEELGPEQAKLTYQEKKRGAFLPKNTMARVIDQVQPDFVFATNSPRAEKAALLVARERTIPSICMMDLFDAREIEDRLGSPGYGSRICVFSDTVRELLIRSGRPVQEIEVTGNPDFDSLASPSVKLSSQRYEDRINPHKKKLVLWIRHAGGPNRPLNEAIDEQLIRIGERNPDLLFVFRPHPNEPKSYDKLPANFVVSDSAEPVQDALLASDVVLTIASTVGLQAVACGIPLLTFDMGPTYQYTPYSKMGLSTGLKSFDEVEAQILAAIQTSNKNTRGVPAPGQAAERVANLAIQLMGGT